MAFGLAIRARRTSLGIGLNEFCERLEISPAYWSRVERELEKPPRDGLIERAAAILGVPCQSAWKRDPRSASKRDPGFA